MKCSLPSRGDLGGSDGIATAVYAEVRYAELPDGTVATSVRSWGVSNPPIVIALDLPAEPCVRCRRFDRGTLGHAAARSSQGHHGCRNRGGQQRTIGNVRPSTESDRPRTPRAPRMARPGKA